MALRSSIWDCAQRRFGHCQWLSGASGAPEACMVSLKGTVRNSVREAMMVERRESPHGYREGTTGPTACRSRSE
ncbi:MAG: hypothetical protein E5Y59_00025 [Mesorhizobium sp.]|nr:MAG: hypothetical protein E5Y59_00025 [Mesorhizobium sp.]